MSEIPMDDSQLAEMERQLRLLMNIAAGDPPRHVSAEAVRRGVRRHRLTVNLAAAAAVVAFGGIGVAVAAQNAGIGVMPAARGLPAGVPPYYIIDSYAGHGPVVAVRATQGGALTGSVHCPAAKPADTVASLAAAANETFYMVCQKTTGTQPPDVLVSRIYRFRLSSSGRVTDLVPVRGGTFAGLSAKSIAVTPSGSEIAVSVHPGAQPYGTTRPEVIVIDPATGGHRIWRGAPPTPGKVYFPAFELSLSADGKELAFLSEPRCIDKKKFPSCKHLGGEEELAVFHAGGGGRLATARVLVKQARLMRIDTGFINDAVLSPDGASVIVVEVGWPENTAVSIVTVSTATGRQSGVLYREASPNGGFSYGAFSADPTRRWFLLDAGRSRGAVNGWIDHGKLVKLKPAVGGDLSFEVW